jgi:hypothetical protein
VEKVEAWQCMRGRAFIISARWKGGKKGKKASKVLIKCDLWRGMREMEGNKFAFKSKCPVKKLIFGN